MGPKSQSLDINSRCPDCDRIQGVHNLVWACKTCNSSKRDKGLYTFLKDRYPDEKKYYDMLPYPAGKEIFEDHVLLS